jgi:hypothetical protein
VDEEAKKRRSTEQVRAHLARADSDLEAAQRLLHPQTDDEFSPRSLVGYPNPGSSAPSSSHSRRPPLYQRHPTKRNRSHNPPTPVSRRCRMLQNHLR